MLKLEVMNCHNWCFSDSSDAIDWSQSLQGSVVAGRFLESYPLIFVIRVTWLWWRFRCWMLERSSLSIGGLNISLYALHCWLSVTHACLLEAHRAPCAPVPRIPISCARCSGWLGCIPSCHDTSWLRTFFDRFTRFDRHAARCSRALFFSSLQHPMAIKEDEHRAFRFTPYTSHHAPRPKETMTQRDVSLAT